MGAARDAPEAFPGSTGTLAALRICPPVQLGEARCIPDTEVRHSSEFVPGFVQDAVLYVPLVVPTLGQLQADKPVQRIGDTLVLNQPSDSVTMFAELIEPERIVLGVWFEAKRPVLHFRHEILEVHVDCAWAIGLQGLAFFRWKPGQISILYAARLPSGEYKETEAQS